MLVHEKRCRSDVDQTIHTLTIAKEKPLMSLKKFYQRGLRKQIVERNRSAILISDIQPAHRFDMTRLATTCLFNWIKSESQHSRSICSYG